MPNLDLSGPRLKLARAKHHIRDLESLFDAFISNNPHRIETEVDDQGIKVIGRFDRPIPVETSAIIGDAIHNIRASLDHLVAAAVRANGQQVSRYNSFPMYEKKSDFEGGVAGKLAGCSDAFVGFVKSREPYGGGKGAKIYAISKMDNLDKHITLLPTVAVTSLKKITITNPDGSPKLTIGELHLSGDGHVNAIQAVGQGLKFEAGTKPVFSVRFRDADMNNTVEVVPYLRSMCDDAADIIENAKS